MDKPSDQANANNNPPEEERSFFGIIIHSFFIIPFLIAVCCILLFTSVRLLTREKSDAYDLLENVKIGGMSKRWQSAFELSRILVNEKERPKDERFAKELKNAYRHSKHDDNRVRQYLALAMGRTKDPQYLSVLIEDINDEKEENLPSIIYALGLLQNRRALITLYTFLDSNNKRIRSLTVAAIGNIGHISSKEYLKKALHDPEANVQWVSAISLAKFGDDSGKGILSKLLNRQYLSQFTEVDYKEQDHLIISAIDAAKFLRNSALNNQIKQLSQNDQNMKVRQAAMEALK